MVPQLGFLVSSLPPSLPPPATAGLPCPCPWSWPPPPSPSRQLLPMGLTDTALDPGCHDTRAGVHHRRRRRRPRHHGTRQDVAIVHHAAPTPVAAYTDPTTSHRLVRELPCLGSPSHRRPPLRSSPRRQRPHLCMQPRQPSRPTLLPRLDSDLKTSVLSMAVQPTLRPPGLNDCGVPSTPLRLPIATLHVVGLLPASVPPLPLRLLPRIAPSASPPVPSLPCPISLCRRCRCSPTI